MVHYVDEWYLEGAVTLVPFTLLQEALKGVLNRACVQGQSWLYAFSLVD